MKIKRIMIQNILNSLRSITSDGDTNGEIIEQFRSSTRSNHYKEYLNSEIPKVSQSIASRIKELSLLESQDELLTFAQTYGFYLQSEETTGNIQLINKNTLTTYSLENKVVKVTHFQGDGFFKSPPYTSTKGKSDSETIARFYINLYEQFSQEEHPIKARLNSYSMHEIEKQYEVYYFVSGKYYYILLNKFLFVFNKELECLGSEKLGSYHNWMDRLFNSFKTVNRTSVSFFVLATIILSNSILQFNVVAPYIEFNDYVYVIGTPFQVTNLIERIHDDNDPFRAVSDAAPFKPLQDALQQFNRSRTRIGLIDQNQLVLDREGTFDLDITISDSNYSRTQTITVRVVR